MELDARKIADGTALEADLCIIGAGPAGIALAREFLGTKTGVLILESGGRWPERRIQKLNDGDVVGDRYVGLRRSRRRAVGGTTHLWNTPVAGAKGAKYVPLDPWDFIEHADLPHGGWPFDYSQLEPFYRRAQAFCGLGPFTYEGEDWFDGKLRGFPLGANLSTKVYQFGAGDIFTRSYPGEICASGNISLCHHATVCGLETDAAGRKVVTARLARLSDGQFQARARVFVLAAGAIENARLLLSNGGGSSAPGNRYGWVGRCFMEHLRDYALTFIPRSPEMFAQAGFYDVHSAPDGSIIGGRIAIAESAVRNNRLPNASVTLFPRLKTWPISVGLVRRMWRRGRLQPTMGYRWSRVVDLSRRCDAFQLLVNFERKPDPENRVALGRRRDFFGIQRAELHWRWRAEEQAALEKLRTFLAAELESAGLGRVEVRPGQRPDPNAHHHSGTTRMHEDPRFGVLDGDGRVHETDNLYIAGASVFPSAGYANPTLTIVALALRLADHLKQRI
ncbi:MAG TPA: GMC family oxidoreductase [Candidatus Binatia bacterium]